MLGFFKSRQILAAIMVIFFIICQYSCTTTDDNHIKYMWLFMAFVAGMVLMIDLMFLHGDQFIYDPNYKTWAAKQDQSN